MRCLRLRNALVPQLCADPKAELRDVDRRDFLVQRSNDALYWRRRAGLAGPVIADRFPHFPTTVDELTASPTRAIFGPRHEMMAD